MDEGQRVDPGVEEAIMQFGKAYAEQDEHDFEELVDAVKAGQVVAETGV